MDWFRWHHGTVNDPKWRVIAKKSGVPVCAVITVFAAFLERASQAVDRGSIEGWSAEDMAEAFDLEEDAMQRLWDAMQHRVLDGNKITGWDRRQVKREREDSTSTERSRKFREAQKMAISENETPCNTNATPCNTQIRVDKSLSKKDKPNGLSKENPKGSRLPEDWKPSPQNIAYAESLSLNGKTQRIGQDFADYWHCKAGKDAIKLDWDKTWEGWCRREADRLPSANVTKFRTAPRQSGDIF